ncbi:MAG: tetratricopeptide repeat protein [Polyangiales bacterium]
MRSFPSVSDEGTEAFGARVASMLEDPNSDLDSLFDIPAFAERSVPTDIPERQAVILGLVNALSQERVVLDEVREGRMNGDSVEYLGLARRDDQPVARFRWVYSSVGVDYLDLLLVDTPRGACVLDYFQLSLGQWRGSLITESVRVGEELVVHQDELQRLNAAAQAGASLEVLSIIDALPEDLQRMRGPADARVDAVSTLGDNVRYREVLDAYAADFHSDRRVQDRLFAGYYALGDWDKAVTALDGLRTLLDDPFMSCIRADIELQREDYPLALEHAQTCLEDAPDLVHAVDLMLVVSLRNGDAPRAAEHARSLRDDFGVDLAEAARLERYIGLDELAL